MDASSNPVPAFERHFTPQELAELWHLSVDTIRAMFAKEPGVFITNGIRSDARARSRRYRTIRIPESVALRVYTRTINPVASAKR
jgi:hypothetical protein